MTTKLAIALSTLTFLLAACGGAIRPMGGSAGKGDVADGDRSTVESCIAQRDIDLANAGTLPSGPEVRLDPTADVTPEQEVAANHAVAYGAAAACISDVVIDQLDVGAAEYVLARNTALCELIGMQDTTEGWYGINGERCKMEYDIAVADVVKTKADGTRLYTPTNYCFENYYTSAEMLSCLQGSSDDPSAEALLESAALDLAFKLVDSGVYFSPQAATDDALTDVRAAMAADQALCEALHGVTNGVSEAALECQIHLASTRLGQLTTAVDTAVVPAPAY